MVRRLLSIAALLSTIFIASSVSFATRSPDPDAIVYRIERNGSPIGRHEVSYTRDNGKVDVDIQFKIRVKIAFITVFKMDHRAHEVWDMDGELENLYAYTERKSGDYEVKVSPDAEGYQVVVNGQPHQAPPNITPTSFTWCRSLFDGQEHDLTLLDTLSGLQKPSVLYPRGAVELDADGEKVKARYFEITLAETGQVTHRIWVDDTGLFLKLGLSTKDGHYIEYYRESGGHLPAPS